MVTWGSLGVYLEEKHMRVYYISVTQGLSVRFDAFWWTLFEIRKKFGSKIVFSYTACISFTLCIGSDFYSVMIYIYLYVSVTPDHHHINM